MEKNAREIKYENISALKELINTYKAITLQMLQKFQNFNAKEVMKQLTGLGTPKCKLCHYLFEKYNIDDQYYTKEQLEFLCNKCVHVANPGKGYKNMSYCFLTKGRQEMLKSLTPEELYNNIQLRINYLENELLPLIKEKS